MTATLIRTVHIPVADDSVCRVLARGGSCRHSLTTIELVAPSRAAAIKKTLPAHVLGGGVAYRRQERAEAGERIDSMLNERTTLSGLSDALLRQRLFGYGR